MWKILPVKSHWLKSNFHDKGRKRENQSVVNLCSDACITVREASLFCYLLKIHIHLMFSTGGAGEGQYLCFHDCNMRSLVQGWSQVERAKVSEQGALGHQEMVSCIMRAQQSWATKDWQRWRGRLWIIQVKEGGRVMGKHSKIVEEKTS